MPTEIAEVPGLRRNEEEDDMTITSSRVLRGAAIVGALFVGGIHGGRESLNLAIPRHRGLASRSRGRPAGDARQCRRRRKAQLKASRKAALLLNLAGSLCVTCLRVGTTQRCEEERVWAAAPLLISGGRSERQRK